MFKLKFVLPMLAFVLAIGMSFAFTSATEDKEVYDTKFILVEEPNGWATVNVDCNPGTSDCRVRYSDDLTKEYILYNTKDLGDPVLGIGQVENINGSAPDPDPTP